MNLIKYFLASKNKEKYTRKLGAKLGNDCKILTNPYKLLGS